MDFIVSRIAMSVCALLVIGILAGVVDIPQLDDTKAELEDFLEGFCRIAEEVAGARADVELEWTVSSLASAAGWPAVRRFRRLRHGRFGDAARRNGRESGALGERPPGDLEIAPNPHASHRFLVESGAWHGRPSQQGSGCWASR